MTEARDKSALRRQAVLQRETAHAERAAEAAAALADRFVDALGPRLERRMDGGPVVSLYWPMRDEIDVRPLMAELVRRGARLALPAMRGADRPLLFRRWREGDPLVPGAFGVQEPGPDARETVPDIVVVPLLAFDAGGNRLGYGGGYYDRTLRALRQAGAGIVAVAVGFDEQELPAVPEEPWDEKPDMIVTDRRCIVAGGEN